MRVAIGSYVAGLALSAVIDLPSSPVIVWAMGLIGLLVHLTGKRSVAADNPVVANHRVRTPAS